MLALEQIFVIATWHIGSRKFFSTFTFLFPLQMFFSFFNMKLAGFLWREECVPSILLNREKIFEKLVAIENHLFELL